MTRSTSGRILRFVAGGAANTALTYGIYLALLGPLGYRAAYTASFVAGIAIAYAINARLVFRVRWSWAAFAGYPLVYLVQYAAGVALLSWLVDGRSIDPRFAPLVVVAVTTPVMFFINRRFLEGRRSR